LCEQAAEISALFRTAESRQIEIGVGIVTVAIGSMTIYSTLLLRG
jgi:hypothetical protein